MVKKKIRMDAYKAIQAAQFHVQRLLDADGLVPENEAMLVGDYVSRFRRDLESLEKQLQTTQA